MNSNSWVILAFMYLSIACLFDCERTTSTPDHALSTTVQDQIDSLFTDYSSLDTPGYAIGVSKEGETLYRQGYGAANLDYGIPITTASVFSIASVSKQFTAACIALLILEERLTLETPVANFVPEVGKYEDTLRLKHLIYNTSGITDYPRLKREGGKSWVTFNYFDVEECIATALAEEELQFKPGAKWDYCNVNFMLLAKIVEQVSGQSFSAFAKERLFEPLGMQHSLINDDVTQIIKNRVTPYNPRIEEYVTGYEEYGVTLSKDGTYIRHPRISPHYGGSGVMTTIDDLLKWSANMTSKSFGGEAFYDLMHKTIKFDHDRDNQAFGLYHGDFNGKKIVAWDGGDWGISSQLLRFPEQEVAIVVLSNLGSGEAFRKANKIAEILENERIL